MAKIGLGAETYCTERISTLKPQALPLDYGRDIVYTLTWRLLASVRV
jgi:hypothetical protein